MAQPSEEPAGRPPDEVRLQGRDEIEAAALEGRQVAGPLERDVALRLLRDGEITIIGRLLGASNATLYCIVRERCPEPSTGLVATCVYKPTRGERPLADFPDGTLALREVGAYAVSMATGWDIVPPTTLGDGPLGRGMVQLWVEADASVDVVELVGRDVRALRRMALFDAVVNNADRKGGHLLPLADDRVQGVDHGLCFAVEPKLRTVLWGWRGEPLREDELAMLEGLRHELAGPLGQELRTLLAPAEVRATIRRVEALLARRRFPLPDRNRPVIPWPPF